MANSKVLIVCQSPRCELSVTARPSKTRTCPVRQPNRSTHFIPPSENLDAHRIPPAGPEQVTKRQSTISHPTTCCGSPPFRTTSRSYIAADNGKRCHGGMNKRSPWYNPNTEESRLLAALEQTRHLCCNSEELMACARRKGSYVLLEAIKEAIDDYAEYEMGNRGYFWGRPHRAGCKHT